MESFRSTPSRKVYDRLESNDPHLQTVEFRYQQIDQRRLAKSLSNNYHLKRLELVASVQVASVVGGFWADSAHHRRHVQERELCYYYDDYDANGGRESSSSDDCFRIFDPKVFAGWFRFRRCQEEEPEMDCEIYTLCCHGIRHNRSLVSLNLSQNHLASYGANCLQEALQNHPSLKVLKLSRCQLEDDGLRKLACSPLGQIEELDLSSNQISDGVYLGNLVYRNKSLRSLDFSKNYLGNVGCKNFLREHGLRSLRKLDLSSNHIARIGAAALGTALARPSCCLEELVLDGNVFLGSLGILAMGTKGFLLNSSLTKLSLNNCSLGDVGATILAQCLGGHQRLQELSLSANHLTSRGGSACLHSIRTLIKIDMSWNRIGTRIFDGKCTIDPAAGQELVGILRDRNVVLRELNLAHTPLPLNHRRCLDFWTALNRTGCRRLLKQYEGEDASILMDLWPHVLARASNDPDILFYLVSKFPTLLEYRARWR